MAVLTSHQGKAKFYHVTYSDGLSIDFSVCGLAESEIQSHCLRKQATYQIITKMVDVPDNVLDSLCASLLEVNGIQVLPELVDLIRVERPKVLRTLLPRLADLYPAGRKTT